MRLGSVEVEPIVDAWGELGELDELYPDVPAEAWEPYRELYPELFAETRWRLPCTSYRCVHSIIEAGLVDEVEAGAEIAPGFVAFDLPGHLPGHLGVRVDDEATDSDSARCAATRRKLLTELVDQNVLVVCGHYPNEGIGRIPVATSA